MKQCAACCIELSKDKFSNKQWKLKEYERRCKECIEKDRPVTKVAPPKKNVAEVSSCSNDGASCWICLEEGPDETGESVVRGCSCRGDAGYAHVKCLMLYAETKSLQYLEKNEGDRVTKPWNQCPNCEQEYNENGLGLKMATGFVSFTERKFPQSELFALVFKLRKSTLENGRDKEECEALAKDGKKLAKEILSKVRKRKAKGEPYSLLACFEKEVYFCLGQHTLNENPKIALSYYQKSREIDAPFFDGLDWDNNIDDKISLAKALGERDNWNEPQKIPVDNVARQKLEYANAIKRRDFGDAIQYGMKLCITLEMTREKLYAERVLTEIVTLSRRIHGPDHTTTKQVEYDLRKIKQRFVMLVLSVETANIGLYQALEYLEDGKKMRVKGPVNQTKRDEYREQTFIVDTSCPPLLFGPGTPVICQGLDAPFRFEGDPLREYNLSHLNGKIGDINRCCDEGLSEHPTVYFEDTSLEPCVIPHSLIRILFELPEVQCPLLQNNTNISSR